MKSPDPKMHFIFSIIKSNIRIIAGLFFIFSFKTLVPNIVAGGVCLILAECVGIAEEYC
jgi:hypothetical protein